MQVGIATNRHCLFQPKSFWTLVLHSVWHNRDKIVSHALFAFCMIFFVVLTFSTSRLVISCDQSLCHVFCNPGLCHRPEWPAGMIFHVLLAATDSTDATAGKGCKMEFFASLSAVPNSQLSNLATPRLLKIQKRTAPCLFKQGPQFCNLFSMDTSTSLSHFFFSS